MAQYARSQVICSSIELKGSDDSFEEKSLNATMILRDFVL